MIMENRESDDFLYHYTKKEHLVSIMKGSFKPFYCLESISYIFDIDDPNDLTASHAVPIICFSDIPKERHNYFNHNSDYGIGMTKKWAEKKGLTPVIYTHPGSLLAAALMYFVDKSIKEIQNHQAKNYGDDNSISLILLLCKPYKGFEYDKDNKTFKAEKTIFYDEREWRYIPTYFDRLDLVLEKITYEDSALLNQKNQILHEKNSLDFGVNDIHCIILKSDSEIEEFMNEIAMSNKYTKEELEIIKEKIQVSAPI
jgi:hypothetical protein